MENKDNELISLIKGEYTDKISSDYVKFFDIYNDDITEISNLCRALSSPIRIQIIKDLNSYPMTLTDIANKYNIQVSSAAFHIQMLLESNLIQESQTIKNKKWYSYNAEKLLAIKLREFINESKKKEPCTREINLGEFIDAQFGDGSGMASENALLTDLKYNNFFIKNRMEAQIIWATSGYIVYPVCNNIFTENEIDSIEISLEICSEARGYNENYKSDITFLLNDIELCTYECPGDYGERYGKYTPNWWYSESTKYGLLTNITIRHDGVYLNGLKVNKNVSLKIFNFNDSYSKLKICVKDNANHQGGFNLFGEKFGDYNQAIKIMVYPK